MFQHRQSLIVKGHDVTPPSEDYRLIPLSRGQFAKVDAADFDWLNQWKWCALWAKHTQSFYAVRQMHSAGRQKTVRMHRQILGLEHGDRRQGDHHNHDTLDNRRGNLRVASRNQNQRNKGLQSNNTSGFKGVSLDRHSGAWRARIRYNGKLIQLGQFDCPKLAHAAYCAAAAELHVEFARTS